MLICDVISNRVHEKGEHGKRTGKRDGGNGRKTCRQGKKYGGERMKMLRGGEANVGNGKQEGGAKQ